MVTYSRPTSNFRGKPPRRRTYEETLDGALQQLYHVETVNADLLRKLEALKIAKELINAAI